jgi:hypothetical protein
VTRFGLRPRIVFVISVLAVEVFLVSGLFQTAVIWAIFGDDSAAFAYLA